MRLPVGVLVDQREGDRVPGVAMLDSIPDISEKKKKNEDKTYHKNLKGRHIVIAEYI